MIEIGRNAYRVFYKCECKRHKGVDWDWSTALINGLEYELGSAGSFVHDCPNCGNLTFRERMSNELCVSCGKAQVVPRVINRDYSTESREP